MPRGGRPQDCYSSTLTCARLRHLAKKSALARVTELLFRPNEALSIGLDSKLLSRRLATRR